jgi:hypothetical protein
MLKTIRKAAQMYTPEIYLGAGIAAGMGAVVMTAKAHKKSDEVFKDVSNAIESVDNEIDDINDNIQQPENEEISPRERRQMLAPIYLEATRRAVILYGPGILLGLTSVVFILASHGVLKGRNRSLIATVSLIERGFSAYRKKVVEEYGEEVDERFYYGADARKVTTLEIDEDGKKKKKKGTENHIPEEFTPKMYERIFDETNINWHRDADLNEYFLHATQTWAHDQLQLKGFILLNDVYKSLGYQETAYGAVVGWSEGVDGDDYVSFGLDKDINQRAGDDRWILDFNVNGVVFETIGER